MGPLLALAPPLDPGVRLLIALLGYGLTALLAHRLRGGFTGRRWAIGLVSVVLVIFGLGAAGVHERQGDLAFLIGMAGAILVGVASPAVPRERRSTGISAGACIAIGILLGLASFGFWYWQTGPERREDIAAKLAILLLFGFLAGAITSLAIHLLRPGNEPKGQADPGEVRDPGPPG